MTCFASVPLLNVRPILNRCVYVGVWASGKVLREADPRKSRSEPLEQNA